MVVSTLPFSADAGTDLCGGDTPLSSSSKALMDARPRRPCISRWSSMPAVEVVNESAGTRNILDGTPSACRNTGSGSRSTFLGCGIAGLAEVSLNRIPKLDVHIIRYLRCMISRLDVLAACQDSSSAVQEGRARGLRSRHHASRGYSKLGEMEEERVRLDVY